MNHYFTNNTNNISNPKEIKVNIFDKSFFFQTDNGVFSKDYLDYATRLLLENFKNSNFNTILDVGCGYGVIGIILHKIYGFDVTMIDVNETALKLTQINCKKNNCNLNVHFSYCLDDVSNQYDMIITNPPIRAGKQVIYQIFSQSYDHLNFNGELWIIIQYKHGGPSAIKYLQSIFQDVKTVYKKKGFYILKCKKIQS